MDIHGHLMTPIWEVPPEQFVQSCIAPPPNAKRRPGKGTAIVYSFSPGAGAGKGGIGERGTVGRAVRPAGTSEAAYHKWRMLYGGMGEIPASRP